MELAGSAAPALVVCNPHSHPAAALPLSPKAERLVGPPGSTTYVNLATTDLLAPKEARMVTIVAEPRAEVTWIGPA